MYIVIGSSGMIGRALVRKLTREGNYVLGIDTIQQSEWFSNYTHYSSIEEAPDEKFWDVKRVFFLAGYPVPTHYLSSPYTTIERSLVLLSKCIRLCVALDTPLTYTSSSEVYGEDITFMTEEVTGSINLYDRRACYKELKRMSEVIIDSARKEHGLRATVVRIFNTYGPSHPNDTRVIPMLLRSVHTGEPFTIYGNGDQVRSFCYVDDIVEALQVVSDSGISVPVNIGNPDERYTINELVRLAEKTFSCDLVVRHVEKNELIGPRFRMPDITRARMLGWEPRTSLTDGLVLTYDLTYRKISPLVL